MTEWWRDDEFWHGVSPEGVPIHTVPDEEFQRTVDDLALAALDFDHPPEPEEVTARAEFAAKVDAFLNDPEVAAEHENRIERERKRAEWGLADPNSLEHLEAETGAFAPDEDDDEDDGEGS